MYCRSNKIDKATNDLLIMNPIKQGNAIRGAEFVDVC